jgi:hypothetical protein
MWSRRQFIKTLGVLGGAVAAPFHWLGRARAAAAPQVDLPPGAELYGGFLLLPEGALVPAFVQQPKLPPPNMCGVGEGKPNAVTRPFATAADLAKEVDFPVYTLGEMPNGLRPGSAFLITHNTGEVYGVSLGFETYNPNSAHWECAVSLWIQPDFPKPYPLWPSGPVEAGGSAVVLEKVDLLPAAGIRVATPAGYVYHWITREVFYTLAINLGLSSRYFQSAVASLILVN